MVDARPKRLAVVVAVALLVLIAPGARTVRGQGDSNHSLAGTWHIRVPFDDGALIGFYTYDQNGTLTGVVSNMFGGLPYPAGFPTLGSPDHGVWRHLPGGGFEFIVYRMLLDPVTADINTITRIRAVFAYEGDRDHLFGTFFVTQWFCPTATTCPDPTSTPPDVPEFAPPGNTFTQSRVAIP